GGRRATSLVMGGVLSLGRGPLSPTAGRRARRGTALDEPLAPRSRARAFPGATSAPLSLLIGAPPPPLEPRPISAGVALVALLPIVRLVAALSPPVLAPVIWLIGIFHVVDLIRALLTAVPMLEQALFLLQLVALLVSVAALRRHFAHVAPNEDVWRRRLP